MGFVIEPGDMLYYAVSKIEEIGALHENLVPTLLKLVQHQGHLQEELVEAYFLSEISRANHMQHKACLKPVIY